MVKAVIYGKGLSQFEAALASAAPQEQFDLYQKHGVVGKLHNFVNAILSSYKRREAFKSVQVSLSDNDALWSFGTLNLIQDGGVRWHSVYLMLLRCLELKDPINRFIRAWRNQDANDDTRVPGNAALSDIITEDEWIEVDRLTKFLEVFYQMTKRLEGNAEYGSLWMSIINLQLLFDELLGMQEKLKREPDESYLKNGVAYGIEKLLTYWEKVIIEPPVSYYAVATILNPKLRLLWFQDHWRHYPDWHKKAAASMKAVFRRYVDAEEEEDPEPEPEALTRRKLPSSHDTRYEKTLSVDTSLLTGSKSYKRARKTTELQQYYDTIGPDLLAAEGSEDHILWGPPLNWWLQVGRYSFPTLFKIALDFLSIPSTSCDCERAFSGGRRTVTCDRNLLSGATIEALQLQKNWLKRKVVESDLLELVDYIWRIPSPTSPTTPTVTA